MQVLTDALMTLSGLPVGGLVAAVVLAGFGLAAYAIYAVLTVTKNRQ